MDDETVIVALRPGPRLRSANAAVLSLTTFWNLGDEYSTRGSRDGRRSRHARVNTVRTEGRVPPLSGSVVYELAPDGKLAYPLFRGLPTLLDRFSRHAEQLSAILVRQSFQSILEEPLIVRR